VATAFVVGVHVDGVPGSAHPNALLDQPPGHRVEPAVEGDVRVLVDAAFVPDHRHEGDGRQRLKHLALLRREDLGWSPLCSAVDALVGDAVDPASEVSARGVRVAACHAGDAVPLHVADTRFDLALLFRLAHGRRVHLEAVVTGQLPVAAVQGGRAADAERRADDGGLEVVGHDNLGHAA
jgi:hypothetical protein